MNMYSVSQQLEKIKMDCKILKPLVVIRSITYNQAEYIKDTLDGFVIQKTNFPFIAIVHDDASTDGTSDIVREYAEKYPNIIKPIFETENQYSKHDGSFQKIIDKASIDSEAKYIAFCEGDDFWVDPLKLQRQVDFLESHPDYGMCYTNFDIKNEVKCKYIKDVFNALPDVFQKEYNSPEEFILRLGYVCPPSWMYRQELLPKTNLDSLDGSFVFFTYFLARTKVKYLPYTTAVYRILKESASHSINPHKTYLRAKNLLETQKKLIYNLKLDESLIEICEFNYYTNYLAFFVRNKYVDEIKIAKIKLANSGIRNKVLFLIHDLGLWWFLRLFCRFKRDKI